MKYFLTFFICFDALHHLAISSGYEDIQRYEDVPQQFNSNAESYEKLKSPSYQYKLEGMAGDVTDLLGSNVHFRQSGTYDDYGRRFFFFNDDESRKNTNPANENLVPMKAPPELVVALAKLSAKREANNIVDPLEELAKRSIVRTGDYWDGVWKEDVEVPTNNVLRSKDKPVPGVVSLLTFFFQNEKQKFVHIEIT
ncbi:PREDICTED: uncharacterized protein LOC106108827 [Papilio polytes]|uniref:uncharacterized protein LOC106108827 n=1 Tax=Papilio polytes TaxID=76194 RepID=UPI0006760D32|nr:PREDICTED: uncharacterized protein LOC106108827 [Papilio polytes]